MSGYPSNQYSEIKQKKITNKQVKRKINGHKNPKNGPNVREVGMKGYQLAAFVRIFLIRHTTNL